MFATTKKALFATVAMLLITSVAAADYYSVRPAGTQYSNSGDRVSAYRSTPVYTAPASRFFAPAAPAAVVAAPAACPAPTVVATPAPRVTIPAVTVPTNAVTPTSH